MTKNPYINENYLTHGRCESLFTQYTKIIRLHPSKILEIGKGSGILSNVLKLTGKSVTTFDNDKNTEPDILGDLRKLPFKNKSFDLVACFEVLEHLPFADFKQALLEINRVTKKFVIISLPEPYTFFLFLTLKFLPFHPKKTWFLKTDKFKFLYPKFKKNESHFWEIGIGVTKKQVEQKIHEAGFAIAKTFTPPGNLYHRFYILKKDS